ncbi:MAG: hypothetical protein DMG06_11035 [Acidobacteria bacterium]|nr:MAG: hypothetical protein DMG06_11035 [Acidobacteriota bacterium]
MTIIKLGKNRRKGLPLYGRYDENFVLISRRSASPKCQRGSVAMTLACASGSLSGVGQEYKEAMLKH